MKDEETFVFGVNPVREKLRASPRDVLEILIATSGEKPALRSIDAEARRIGLPVTYVNREFLSRLTRGEKHQGVLAKVEAHRHVPFAVLEQRISEPNAPGRVLILDGLTDPRNFGALLRTAEAVGIQHVIIPKDRSVAITPTVVKASAGAVHYLKIYRETNLRRVILKLKE